MGRAITQICIFVGAISIISGCAAPGSIGTTRSLATEAQQPEATGWKIKFEESYSNPVVVDGVLYVGSADGAVYALDPKTGETKWRFQTGKSLLDMTPAVESGTVFIGSEDQSFYAIDAETGKKKWSYVVGQGMASLRGKRSAAVINNGTVYFVTVDGLHALDALTGKRRWLFETLQEKTPKQKKRLPSGPVMGDSVIFLTAWPSMPDDTPRKSFVYAVDPESGKAKWVISVNGLDITAPVEAKGVVFFAVKEEEPTLLTSPLLTSSSERVTLYAINASDGQVKWKIGTEDKFVAGAMSAEHIFGAGRLLVADNTIIFSTDTSLLVLEPETGRHLWNFFISADKVTTNFRADNKHLYVVTYKGYPTFRSNSTLHALVLSTGQEKWSQRLSGYVRVAMIHDGVVYADGERLHAIDAATGKELWSFKGTGRERAHLISGGRIFLTSPTERYFGTTRVDQGYLYAIDARTGKIKP